MNNQAHIECPWPPEQIMGLKYHFPGLTQEIHKMRLNIWSYQIARNLEVNQAYD